MPPPASKNTVVDATKDGGFATSHGRICAVWSQSAEDIVAEVPRRCEYAGAQRRCSLQYNDACVLTVNELTETLKHGPSGVSTTRGLPSGWRRRLTKMLCDSFDWCLEDSVLPLPKDCRCVCVSLKKRPVAHGVVTWWSTLFAEVRMLMKRRATRLHWRAREKKSGHARGVPAGLGRRS